MRDYTRVPDDIMNAASKRLWTAIGVNAEEVAARINADQKFVADIARFMIDGNCRQSLPQPSLSQERAREIMGKNFFSIDDAVKYFGVLPTGKQMDHLFMVPFSEEVLRLCKDTHRLVAVFPLSILDIISILRRLSAGLAVSCMSDEHFRQLYSGNKGDVSWQLVRREPVSGTTSMPWARQKLYLPQEEEVPTVQIVTYTIVGYFLTTGERMFRHTHVRCSDHDVDDRHVSVGFVTDKEISVDSLSDREDSCFVGLSAVRKHPSSKR